MSRVLPCCESGFRSVGTRIIIGKDKSYRRVVRRSAILSSPQQISDFGDFRVTPEEIPLLKLCEPGCCSYSPAFLRRPCGTTASFRARQRLLPSRLRLLSRAPAPSSLAPSAAQALPAAKCVGVSRTSPPILASCLHHLPKSRTALRNSPVLAGCPARDSSLPRPEDTWKVLAVSCRTSRCTSAGNGERVAESPPSARAKAAR